MKVALGIFAKTVGVSPVKTRLAVDVGIVAAEEFYRLSLRAIEAVAVEAKDFVQPYWAVAEENCVGDEIWGGFPALWTGEGGLGQRLCNVYDRLWLEYGAVVIIGTDSPQIYVGILRQAVEKLKKNQCVIGSCRDGGFYLFAANVEIPGEVWLGVEYSQDYTLRQLLQQLEKYGINVDFLSEMTDVDVVGDLRVLKDELEANNHLNLEQKSLIDWLKSAVLAKSLIN